MTILQYGSLARDTCGIMFRELALTGGSMVKPPDIRKELAELDRATWHLWIVTLTISISLAAGIVVTVVPVLEEGIIQIGTRHIEMLPQLLVGLLTLILLTATYVVIRQRDLNRMRDFILATHPGSLQLSGRQSRDRLTGVFDRKGLPDILDLESSRADRYDSAFSVVHCDIRHFHTLNEREGNFAGDQVLQEVARILRATVRKADIVVRYESDEFLCVLPATDSPGGEVFLRRAEGALRSSSRLRELTLDFGLATYSPETNLDVLLVDAEKDMERRRAGAPHGTN